MICTNRLGVAATTVLLTAALAATHADAAKTASIPASRDNTLIETTGPARSEGAGPYVFAGRIDRNIRSIRRGVIAFDVAAQLPAKARIRRAALVVHVDRTGRFAGGVAAHRLLAAWGEGTSASGRGLGAPATPGDSTWVHTFYDAAFWGTPGGDFVPVASASGVDAGDGYIVLGPTDALAADVQAWLERPDEAHGWLLRGDESSPGTVLALDSREASDAALRPLLVVQYTGGGRQGGVRGDAGDDAAFDAAVRRLLERTAAPRHREAAAY